MGKIFSIKPGITMRGRRFMGVRGWAGKPTHPPLTDFPIVAYVLGAAFDVISYIAYYRGYEDVGRDAFVAASYVFVGGLLVSFLTLLSGFWDWWKGIPREGGGWLGKAKRTQVWRTINWHATIMLTVTVIVVFDVAIRLADFAAPSTSITVAILSILAAGLISLGATYGGELVYEFQFNVESLKGSTVWNETESDQFPADRR